MAFRSAFSSAFSPAFRAAYNTASPEDLGISGLLGLPMYLHDGDIYLRPDGRSFYNRPQHGYWNRGLGMMLVFGTTLKRGLINV